MQNIVDLLVIERNRIDSVINILQPTAPKRRGRPPASATPMTAPVTPNPGVTKRTHKSAVWSASRRKLQGLKMRAFWAARRSIAK